MSIGVHLLNLLAIPAVIFVYYFKNLLSTGRGSAIALALSVILALIMYGLIRDSLVASKNGVIPYYSVECHITAVYSC
ncbi:MAG: DUF2723 domain-containing protein [Bacteroidales bacterium]